MKHHGSSWVGILGVVLMCLALPTHAQALSCGATGLAPAIGPPIPIGAIVGQTGPDDFSASTQAAAAYFKCVNAHGGIHGRPIDYIVRDDAWNPDKARAAADALIGQHKVLAMAGSSSFVECDANAARYESEGLMVVAGVGVARRCFHARNYVPMNTGPRLSATLATQFAAQRFKVKKVVCLPTDVPGLGAWACGGAVAFGKANGIAVETLLVNPGAFDPAALMKKALASSPDALLFNLPKGLLLPMLKAVPPEVLQSKTVFLSTAPAYSAELPALLGREWRERLFVNAEFNPIEFGGADNRNWKAVMDSYALPADPRDAFSQAGYLAARLLTQTLQGLPPEALTRERVTAALRATQTFDSDMLCRNFYIGDGPRHNANHGGPVLTMVGKGYAMVSMGCLLAQDPELDDVLERERKRPAGPLRTLR